MPAPKETQELVDDICNRIEDISLGNEELTSIVLSLVILKLLNRRYPPDLSSANKKLIKQNYPDATAKDMLERGLSDEGLLTAVTVFNQAALIAIDYSPATNIEVDRENDLANESNRAEAQALSEKAFSDILSTGFSPFGTSASLITNTVIQGLSNGVACQKVIRILSEAMATTLRYSQQSHSRLPTEEEMISLLCSQMGISKATARKYLNTMVKD